LALIDDISGFAAGLPAELAEKKGVFTLKCVVAERKAFLSKKKLEYIARFRIDESARQVRFTEMLMERGSGMSGGAGDDMAPGFGFKKETYSTGRGPRGGSITEQSDLFGKEYTYNFDFGAIRQTIEGMAAQAGYEFDYRITAAGL
jgi:hypothetical protein